MSRTRTWYSDIDVALPDVSTVQKSCHSAHHIFKEMLLGGVAGTHGWEGAAPSSSNWTLDNTCDSSSTSSSDLLGGATFTDAKWVRAAAASPHTWWTAHNSGLYICCDYSSGADQTMNVYFALSAFTGGTTTARPTSTTEWTVVNGSAAQSFWSANAAAGKMSMCRDSTGGFYVICYQTSQSPTPGFFMTAQLVDQACAADTAPYFSCATNSFGGTILNTSLTGAGRNAPNTASVNVQLGLLGFPSGTLTGIVTALNADSKGKQYACELAYASGTTAGDKGRLTDAAWSGTLGAGRIEPSTGNVERCLINGMWIPFSVYPSF